MITPLKKIALHDLQKKPILMDANILMVGIERRGSDSAYSFKNKRYCTDVIRRHQLPGTLGEYIKTSLEYL